VGSGLVITGSSTITTPAGVTTPAPEAPLAEWQKRGATEVPPAALQHVSLQGIDVVNEAGGTVGDQDARAWAESWLRSYGFLLWAVSRSQDQFLLSSGLAPPGSAVLQPNVTDIAQARGAGARVEYSREAFRRLVLRTVPQTLDPKFRSGGFVWKPYAFFLDALGPVTTTWVDGSGARSVKSQAAAGEPLYELIGGELRHDPLMGDVWIMASDWSCTSPPNRQGLAPLCNP